MGLLAQGSLGAKGVEIVQSPPIPPPTTPRVCVCVCVCARARARARARAHAHTSPAPSNNSDFQICGPRAGFVRHGLVGQEVCCKDVERPRAWGSSGHRRAESGRSLRRGRGLGSCDCPLGLSVHPVSGLPGQGRLGLQVGL